MKIFVLGSKGMLGRYVSTYLSDYYTIIELNKEVIDASNINELGLISKLTHFGASEGDVIINCMGTIKPMIDKLGDLNAILVNSAFPHMLANVCEKLLLKMIHPTTDCVFTGRDGKYTEESIHDITDVYGRSKSLGEPKNCTVIRTSIIGEEVNQGRSLVEWVKSNKNKSVNGFTNHYWNGITCLQFAKICHSLITTDKFWLGVRHIHSNTLSKYQLVKTISDVFDLKIDVVPIESKEFCDRTLNTIFNKEEWISNGHMVFNIPSLETQIFEMKNFSDKLSKQQKNDE